MTGRPPKPAIDRFWSSIKKTNSCWLYVRKKNPDNQDYVLFRAEEGRLVYAHIYSWEIHKGEVPQGKLVLHKCDVRNCVNPDHLWIGTQKENIQDMLKKGRGNYLSGPDNPMWGRKGPLSPTWGRKHSEETRKKISEKRRAYYERLNK